MRKVIQTYKQKCLDSGHGVPRGAYNISQYIAVAKAKTVAVVSALGKMLWAGESLEFARSALGGRLSDQAAAHEWETLNMAYVRSWIMTALSTHAFICEPCLAITWNW